MGRRTTSRGLFSFRSAWSPLLRSGVVAEDLEALKIGRAEGRVDEHHVDLVPRPLVVQYFHQLGEQGTAVARVFAGYPERRARSRIHTAEETDQHSRLIRLRKPSKRRSAGRRQR